jgi:ABC-2 type transport system ATP-binding protein
MSASFLKLKNISKSYGDKRAVEDFSLSVPEKSIYGMIGPNGAGKTTTIRMIMDIIAPDSGQVLLRGTQVDETFKNHVGYLPEERGLHKKMKIKDVIRFLAELKEYKTQNWDEEIDSWLAKMSLSDCRDKKVEELSKGMQQKLQFITTVFHKPDIIILDELFSGLDPLNIELVKNSIFELRSEGATVLFSTHVMEQAEKMCDHIVMIHEGVKMLDGELGAVKARFGKNSVHIVFDGDPGFVERHPTVSSILAFPSYLEAKLNDGASHMQLMRDLAANYSVTRFELVEPSLYNIFIETAGVAPDSEQFKDLKEGALDV